MPARSKGVLNLESFMPFRLNRLASAMSEQLAHVYEKQFGIDVPSWRVLATLGEFGEVTARFVGQSTRMHKTRVSRAVSGLSEQGYVESIPSFIDRREALLSLTTRGSRLYEKLVPLALARERELLEGLSSAELEAFVSAVTRLEIKLQLRG